MSEMVNVNGSVCATADAVVPVMDHGFLFGDSIYETLRTYGGRFFRFDAHFDRLRCSAAALQLELPLTREQLVERVGATIEAADEPEAAVRIVVTRGVGPMDLDPSACGGPNVLVFVRPRPRYPKGAYVDGLSLAVVSRARNSRKSLDPNVKSGNYLNNVLALVEARSAGAYEGLMLNPAGEVAEGTTSNVFAVAGGRVATPPLSAGLLGGITRGVVLEACSRLGVPCSERTLTPEELRSSDEVFITSALKQVMPITRIDGRRVGTGTIGPTTRRLLSAYREAVEAETGVVPADDP